jgi:hypothetical protein
MQLWLALKKVLPLHTCQAIQTCEQVEHSVRQRRIAGNHKGSLGHRLNKHPILAIPVYDVVLDRGTAAFGADKQASTSVPVKNVVTHCTRRAPTLVLYKPFTISAHASVADASTKTIGNGVRLDTDCVQLCPGG